MQELKVSEELGILKKGGLVVADNVLRPGAPEYRKHVRDNPNYETKAIPGLIIPGEFEVSLLYWNLGSANGCRMNWMCRGSNEWGR